MSWQWITAGDLLFRTSSNPLVEEKKPWIRYVTVWRENGELKSGTRDEWMSYHCGRNPNTVECQVWFRQSEFAGLSPEETRIKLCQEFPNLSWCWHTPTQIQTKLQSSPDPEQPTIDKIQVMPQEAIMGSWRSAIEPMPFMGFPFAPAAQPSPVSRLLPFLLGVGAVYIAVKQGWIK